MGQGFLFSKALPYDGFISLMTGAAAAEKKAA
jgi:sensor c-di-GMP phosphodiesterase-like protein